jgi:hypothetical protein
MPAKRKNKGFVFQSAKSCIKKIPWNPQYKRKKKGYVTGNSRK